MPGEKEQKQFRNIDRKRNKAHKFVLLMARRMAYCLKATYSTSHFPFKFLIKASKGNFHFQSGGYYFAIRWCIFFVRIQNASKDSVLPPSPLSTLCCMCIELDSLLLSTVPLRLRCCVVSVATSSLLLCSNYLLLYCCHISIVFRKIY